MSLVLTMLLLTCPLPLLAAQIGQSGQTDEQPDARWLSRSEQPGLSPLRKQAYAHLAQLRLLRGDLDQVSPALSALQSMGLDALPMLAEALDDNTPTRDLRIYNKRGRSAAVVRVNEVVARLIVLIAEHHFVLGEDAQTPQIGDVARSPELVPQFRKVVLDWYARNRHRTRAQRKIADVSDICFRNRLDAVEWLGKNQVAAGKTAIVRYINRMLDSKEESTLKWTELAESSLALGQIGDRSALPAVRRACKHLSYWGTGSSSPSDLFMAYQGLALLGRKQEALAELNALFAKYSQGMEPSTRREYEEHLQAAAVW